MFKKVLKEICCVEQRLAVVCSDSESRVLFQAKTRGKVFRLFRHLGCRCRVSCGNCSSSHLPGSQSFTQRLHAESEVNFSIAFPKWWFGLLLLLLRDPVRRKTDCGAAMPFSLFVNECNLPIAQTRIPSLLRIMIILPLF